MSFKAFHKNIKNRFAHFDKQEPDYARRQSELARNALQKDVNKYVDTLESIGLYLSKINNNDMKGYYMSAHFKNNSKDKIELFSVGSHVSESSK